MLGEHGGPKVVPAQGDVRSETKHKLDKMPCFRNFLSSSAIRGQEMVIEATYGSWT